VGREAPLPIEIEPPAQRQIDEADEWWQVNRTAAPNAIRDDFESAAKMLAMNPNIGRRSVKTKRRNVRQVFLHRVGYIVYYRVTGSPPRLQIIAFWHSSRSKGPPI
jgi:plasmid stabilization system protein ParE